MLLEGYNPYEIEVGHDVTFYYKGRTIHGHVLKREDTTIQVEVYLPFGAFADRNVKYISDFRIARIQKLEILNFYEDFCFGNSVGDFNTEWVS